MRTTLGGTEGPAVDVFLPEVLRDQVVEFPECSYGANRVTLLLADGRLVEDVILAWGRQIVKVGGKPVASAEDLSFSTSDAVDVFPDSPAFGSNQEFFEAIAALAEQLDSRGLNAPADDIRTGLSCVNGLTDGWALLMESLFRVRAEFGSRLLAPEANALGAMALAAYRAVYRV